LLPDAVSCPGKRSLRACPGEAPDDDQPWRSRDLRTEDAAAARRPRRATDAFSEPARRAYEDFLNSRWSYLTCVACVGRTLLSAAFEFAADCGGQECPPHTRAPPSPHSLFAITSIHVEENCAH